MNYSLEQRIKIFARLGEIFRAVGKNDISFLSHSEDKPIFDEFNKIVKNEFLNNQWFIEKFIRYQLSALGNELYEDKLYSWLSPYFELINKIKPKNVGVVFAGNIPLVGFMDFLDILIVGHKLIGKLSSKDKNLLKFISQILFHWNPDFKNFIYLTEDKISDFQLVIATGSNNSAKYFEFYFSKYPHIIRKNRNSVAVLSGNESDEQLKLLADDILLYFGLGCRNVSKIFIPENFDLNRIFKAIYHYSFVLDNPKYENNYIYNRTIYLLNKIKFFENGFFIIKEDLNLASPVSVLFYETYKSLNTVEKQIHTQKDNIQIIVSNLDFKDFKVVDFGKSQQVKLDDYADDVNVLEFLLNN